MMEQPIPKGTVIQALPTRYHMVTFRSRLEARYAVLFDCLDIEWVYEPQGYLFKGECYLPDFWLPTFNGGMFAEVKPDSSDFGKARRFARAIKKNMWFCGGQPDIRVWKYMQFDGKRYEILHGIPCGGPAQNQNRMYAEPGLEIPGQLMIDPINMIHVGDKFAEAVYQARTAKF